MHRFDTSTGTGSVITDAGIVVPFDAEAFDASRLRHVRTGQRLTVQVEGEGPDAVVVALALGTVGLPPSRTSRP